MKITKQMLDNAGACEEQVEMFCKLFPKSEFPDGVETTLANIGIAVAGNLDFEWFVNYIRRVLLIARPVKTSNIVWHFNQQIGLLHTYIDHLRQLKQDGRDNIYNEYMTYIVYNALSEIDSLLLSYEPISLEYLSFRGFQKDKDGNMFLMHEREGAGIRIKNDDVYLVNNFQENVETKLEYCTTKNDIDNLVKLVRGW